MIEGVEAGEDVRVRGQRHDVVSVGFVEANSLGSEPVHPRSDCRALHLPAVGRDRVRTQSVDGNQENVQPGLAPHLWSRQQHEGGGGENNEQAQGDDGNAAPLLSRRPPGHGGTLAQKLLDRREAVDINRDFIKRLNERSLRYRKGDPMRKIGAFAAVLALLLAVPAIAQRTSGTIRGTVTDSSGGVIPGATVTILSELTGFTRNTTTNAVGLYVFPDLPVGSYNIEVELTGFRTAALDGVILNVAGDLKLDFALEPGALAETVTVEAASISPKLIGGDVSGIVTGQQVRELPLNGRNFLQLATLMPGVSAPDFLNVKDKGLLGGSDISVSGGDVTANLWTVDGANNNDVGSNRTILVYPSVEIIEEFKILRNNYGPEFGQSRRSADQHRHPQRHEPVRRERLLLRPQRRFERDELFPGASGQGQGGAEPERFRLHLRRPDHQGQVSLLRRPGVEPRAARHGAHAKVPTEPERAGDFGGPQIPGCTGSMPIDPLTGAPFPGNRIPADRLSPAGQLYLQLYPLPNTIPGPEAATTGWTP